jgi:hypothetical protein
MPFFMLLLHIYVCNSTVNISCNFRHAHLCQSLNILKNEYKAQLLYKYHFLLKWQNVSLLGWVAKYVAHQHVLAALWVRITQMGDLNKRLANIQDMWYGLAQFSPS